jgi:hypothetical protein
MNDMYKDIERIMKTTNGNHFGFDGMTLTEMHNILNTLKEDFMIGM